MASVETTGIITPSPYLSSRSIDLDMPLLASIRESNQYLCTSLTRFCFDPSVVPPILAYFENQSNKLAFPEY